jgi:hypothetical protein
MRPNVPITAEGKDGEADEWEQDGGGKDDQKRCGEKMRTPYPFRKR